MSDFKHKDGRGSLFRNDRREKDTQPTHKGSAVIHGKEVWVSAWVEETQQGQKYFSLSFEDKEDSAPPNNFTDDDIPF